MVLTHLDGSPADSPTAGDSGPSVGTRVSAPENSDELQFRVFGWNVGGSEIVDLQETVRDFVGGIKKEDLILVQEFPRAREGWSVERHRGWQCVSHREEHLWRGTGIVFHPDVWSIRRRIHARRGTWFRDLLVRVRSLQPRDTRCSI